VILEDCVFDQINFAEYFSIYLFVILSSLLLFSASDMLAAYLVLEMQTLAFFVLAAIKRNSAYSAEAGIKYFVIGAVISAIFLYGCSLCYGYFGTLNFYDLTIMMPFLTNEFGIDGYYFVLIAVFFIFITFLFKLAVVPFHFWAPDVYDGSPMASTVVFAIIPKLALFHFFIKWIYLGMLTFPELFWVLGITAFLSIIVGLLFALGQTRLKRFIIWCTIAQTGFLILGLSRVTIAGIISSYYFLINYLLTAFLLWAIISTFYSHKAEFWHFYKRHIYPLYLTDFSRLFKKHGSWGLLFGIVFFSFLGLPPLTGFFAKAFVLYSLAIDNFIYLAVIIVLINSIAAFYYLRFLKIIFFDIANSPFVCYLNHTFYINNNIFYIVQLITVCSYLLISLFFEPELPLMVCYKACISTFSGF